MAIKFPNGKSDLMNFRIEDFLTTIFLLLPAELNSWRGGTFDELYVQNMGCRAGGRAREGLRRPESLPSKLGHAREHLPERFARRLEPGTNGDERHFWFAVFVHRSKRERPVEYR